MRASLSTSRIASLLTESSKLITDSCASLRQLALGFLVLAAAPIALAADVQSEVSGGVASVKVLHSFSGKGFDFQSPLVVGGDGKLYGVAVYVEGPRTTFRMTSGGQYTDLSVLFDVGGGNLISRPEGGFYTSTRSGGSRGYGALYRMTPHGKLVELHGFAGQPNGDCSTPTVLALAADGALYGATDAGGEYGRGCIFKLTPQGVLTVLHMFNAEEFEPRYVSSLIQSSNGEFYGTTRLGGKHGGGTAFKLGTDGAFTVIHSFGNGDNAIPLSLIEGTDGLFYGATQQGGRHDGGVIFRMDHDGAVTVIHHPDGPENYVSGSLLQGHDGNFYGVTCCGGRFGLGSVFRLTTEGEFTRLHSFLGPEDGGYPQAGLVEHSDGEFYGTTSHFGPNDSGGTIYRLRIK